MRTLTMTLRKHYLTPIEKPITSLALNSLTELTAEGLAYSYQEWSMPVEASVLLGSIGLRCGLQVIGLCFQSLRMRSKEGPVQRWIDRIFLVDMRRDAQFLAVDEEKYQHMRRHYQPSHLFTNFLKSYSILNMMRGAHFMISTGYWQEIPSFLVMHSHDPYFVLPLLIIVANYHILSRSRHPFFIHLTRPQNKLMCLNIAFMGGLLFVPAPAIYPLTYLGICLGHIGIRWVKHRGEDMRIEVKRWWLKLIGNRKKND